MRKYSLLILVFVLSEVIFAQSSINSKFTISGREMTNWMEYSITGEGLKFLVPFSFEFEIDTVYKESYGCIYNEKLGIIQGWNSGSGYLTFEDSLGYDEIGLQFNILENPAEELLFDMDKEIMSFIGKEGYTSTTQLLLDKKNFNGWQWLKVIEEISTPDGYSVFAYGISKNKLFMVGMDSLDSFDSDFVKIWLKNLIIN